MSNILIKYKYAWIAAYSINDEGYDPHQAFADILKISRDEAKKLCYRIIFEIPILRSELVSLKEKHERRRRR